MEREPRAEGVFYKAMVELTRSMVDNDPEKGIKAMDDMVGFVFDMAIEHKGKDWGDKICPIMTANEEKLGDIKKIVKELVNPMTTIKWNDEEGTVTFNDQDVTDETMLMIEAFEMQDAKKLGFIYGDTLDKHMEYNRRNPKPSNLNLY